MPDKLQTRQISIFLLFAFGIAWAVGLVIYLNGGLTHSPQLAPGLTLALVLMATGYMFAPALANVLTRLVTREGWGELYLRPHLRRGWAFWLAGWVVPAILTILGGVLFFALFPQTFDPTLQTVKTLMARSGAPANAGPWTVLIGQTLSGIAISPMVNGLFTFGEEFGWRAYLLPRLMPLGGRRAVLVLGIIWGIWHWPVIAMGYEYGFNYTGFPWLGFLVFTWFTILLTVFLSWITLRGGSVWPAVIGHAAINGIAQLPALAMRGQPNLLLGPLPHGLIGSAGFALLALAIFLSRRALAPSALRSQEQEPIADLQTPLGTNV